MFWKRPHGNDATDVEALRDYVAERLRISLEFATLGAYELLEHGVAGADESPRDDSDPRREPAPPRNCDHRSSRRSVRPHVSAARVACEHGAQPHGGVAHGSLLEDDDVPPCLDARSKSRRAGAVDVAEQPCVWTGGSGA
jgi:hypothetical protein